MSSEEMRACLHCGQRVKASRQVYCSKQCYVASRWTARVCEHCGKAFRARKIYVARGQMKFCSRKCGQLAARVGTTIEYGGDTYHLSNGYYVCALTGRRLHHVIWEAVFGPIPQGHVLHHRDGNKINNDIANLELMEWGEHTRHHHLGVPHSRKPRSLCHCGKVVVGWGLCGKHYQRWRTAQKRAFQCETKN